MKIAVNIWCAFCLCLAAINSHAQKALSIIQKPIEYSQQRQQLSLLYLKQRHGITALQPTIHPQMVVLHFTDGGTIKSNYNYFNKPNIENGRSFNKNAALLNVGAHYLVDRDGVIYQLIPDTLFARHTIGLNYCAIGIENIGSAKQPLTAAQVNSNAALIELLYKKYAIQFVIGHSEYASFKGTTWFKETDPSYFTYKNDPGQNFLIAVRKLIKHLPIKNKPS